MKLSIIILISIFFTLDLIHLMLWYKQTAINTQQKAINSSQLSINESQLTINNLSTERILHGNTSH